MEAMEGKVRFAVVGFGHIGRRHASMITRNEEAQLVAIVDSDHSVKTEVEEMGVPYFSSMEDLISSELKFDVVNVATPNSFHAEQTKLGLKNGLHVVCEKPMALSREDCESMLQDANEANKKLFCVMQNRFSPPSKWLKEVVSSGKLGKIYLVQVNCFWNRDDRYYKKGGWRGTQELDGGTLFTQFSHFIDVLYWLFGSIEITDKSLRDFNHQQLTDFEDSGLINFKLNEGGMGSLNYTTSVWDSNLESSITIIAENGSIKVGGQYMDKIEHCTIKDYEMPTLDPINKANDYGSYKGSAANHQYVIQEVVDVLKGRKERSIKPEDGAAVVDIIERIYS